ncbi:hypothetical protein [Flavobacterium sp. 2]|uniref:hypothetical protein n=1 Tax=Flavobacterium sp. 2 TaxID=308053 RepID=UPI000C1A5FB4|nr:hypothetical protein [Flavobacterium sp. 2]PIF60069.1 hypothetical protein CLU99_3314 [Flavobacterium sp. 2]
MEDYAVVLANDLVVKASNFGGIKNLKYNRQGKVTSFTFEGQKIVALFQFKSNEFLDYVDESYFEKIKEREVQKEGDKYDGVDKKLWENFAFKKYDKLVRAQFGDTIFGLLRDSSGLCYNYHKWTYTNPYKGPSDPRPAPEALASGQLCDTFIQGTHAKDFFDKYKNYTFLDTDENDIRLIGEIASVLKTAGEKTAEAFLNFNLTGVDTSKFTFHINENQLSRDELLEYKKGLELWLKMLKKYQTEISKLGHEEQLFIAIDVMYRHNMLTLLTVDQRISILKILVEKKALMNWYWVNFSIGFVHKEDLAIHILESFTNTSDANSFLDKLISTNVTIAEFRDSLGKTVKTKSVTLYKMLFYRMDDYGGTDNFTKFAKQLERIVLLKNNIVDQNIPPSVSIEELKSTTKAQFFWREKQPEKGPIQERIKYKIINSTEKQISIKESVWLKTELIEQYTTTSSTGVDIITGYKEVPIDLQERTFPPLNHFDLVSIHFFNNPSFIDLTSDPTYVGKHYYTYAGLIEYILEKERTKKAEDIFNATLFAISLAFGIGELAAALRSLNFARTLLGVSMITSDTAMYLSEDTEFHNYLVETYGEVMARQIIDTMRPMSTIASLGTNTIAGSGILKAYSREEALRLVGTGEAILKDSKALSKMLPKEIEALNEAIKRIKKELYSIRKVPEAVDIIVSAKADALFFKFPGLKNALAELSDFERLAFRSKFLNLSEREVNALQSHWIGSTFATKKEIIQNSEIWIKNIKLQKYLKEGRYELISILYNKEITEAYLHNGFRYVITKKDALDPAILGELDKAIIIANRTDDVAIIANNCGYPEHIVQKVKNHLFKNEYLLPKDDGTLSFGRLQRFETVEDTFGDSDLWNHFTNTPYEEITDIRKAEFRWLIAHEYVEAGLMEKHMPIRSFINGDNYLSYDVGAHYLSVNKIGWSYEFSQYYTLGRLQVNIPDLPTQNLDNLDDILNQLINFYKLE